MNIRVNSCVLSVASGRAERRSFVSKKKTCYQSKLSQHYEILQEHSRREDRQFHPDGDNRLRINLSHAVLHEPLLKIYFW